MEFVMNIILSSVRMATPLIFLALAELYSQRAGLVHIGLEGLASIGSLVGFLVSLITGSPMLGVLAGAAVGILVNMIFAYATVTLCAEQIVYGMAINIFAPALAAFIYRVYFGAGSELVQVGLMNTLSSSLGITSDNFLVRLLLDQTPMVYLAYGLVIFTVIYFNRTKSGLNYKAVGEYPKAAATLGINVIGVKYAACAICGALAPANPRMAAELAWRDGCVSHHNNGILAEVFNALIVSMAYVETDMQVILDKAMRMIPRDSEFYSVLAFACQACGQSRDYRQAWELCEEKYKEYNWVHAYPNLAAEVVAIRFAGNSFERAMTILMMAGQDNDCTGGPIGHAYGVMLGLGALDDKFVAPLRDQLDTYVRTMESQSITSLSKKTTDAILKYN